MKRGSAEYYQAYSEASHWVSNARTPLYINKKDNQTYIQTWHGTPLKRLANDMKVVRMPVQQLQDINETSTVKRHVGII